jgi:hypothetical protein
MADYVALTLLGVQSDLLGCPIGAHSLPPISTTTGAGFCGTSRSARILDGPTPGFDFVNNQTAMQRELKAAARRAVSGRHAADGILICVAADHAAVLPHSQHHTGSA